MIGCDFAGIRQFSRIKVINRNCLLRRFAVINHMSVSKRFMAAMGAAREQTYAEKKSEYMFHRISLYF